MNRSKVPDSADAAFNKQVAYLLRARCRDSDDAYMHIHLAAEAAELGYREDRLALEFGRLFAQVERGDYIEPVCLEAAVVEQRLAEAAGADIIGSDELVAQIQKGEINFDAAIATPNMMAKVGRIGKILGPRGLMPNPKLGTVTMDVAKMVSELKAGRVEYRADRYGICHVPLGKKSFSEQQLVENYAALYTEILRVKPSSAKGKYVKSISVSSTMGPGVKVDPAVQRDFLAE